jgi:hypothetical protein
LILRCYAVGIAFFVALAETEWEAIFRLWQVWLSFHSFLLVDYFLSHPKLLRAAEGNHSFEIA